MWQHCDQQGTCLWCKSSCFSKTPQNGKCTSFLVYHPTSVWEGVMELQEEQLPSPPSHGAVLSVHSKKKYAGPNCCRRYLHLPPQSCNLYEFSCLFLLSCLTVSAVWFTIFVFFPARLVNPQNLKNTDIPVIQNDIIFSGKKKSAFLMLPAASENLSHEIVYLCFVLWETLSSVLEWQSWCHL